ncbi:MAG: hypothetical protein WA915_08150 [Candidatus Aminicenantaceae bacterium]
MKIKVFFLSLLFLFLTQNTQINAQFNPNELAERAKWEEFLKTAEIVEYKDVGHGVTRPFRLTLKKENLEAHGVWKNPSGIQEGYLEGWQYEIAAYEIDKLLELNMVPPTVERRFNGRRGSLQLWVEHKCNLLELVNKKLKFPRSKLDPMNKMKYLARAFDSLIANEDRTRQNVLYTEDWRTILIDHSRSFRYSKQFSNRLVFGKRGVMGRKLFKQLPREFVEKIKALDAEDLHRAVGLYLKEKELDGILKRKKMLLDEIQEMINDEGEEKVLY